MDLFLGFVDPCEIHRFESDAEESELLREQVDRSGPVGRGVSVECDDQVALGRRFQCLCEFPGESDCRLRSSGCDGFDGLGGEYRLIDRTRIVVRVRIVHETHGM